MENFQEKDWYLNFRMQKEAFNKMCDRLCPLINIQTTNMLEPISFEKRLPLAIYRLANNVEFHDVANLFGIGTSRA